MEQALMIDLGQCGRGYLHSQLMSISLISPVVPASLCGLSLSPDMGTGIGRVGRLIN